MSLLLLLIGARSGAVTKKHIGWPAAGFRHDPEELERRLERQRDGSLTRRRFDELLAETARKAEKTKSASQRRALNQAVEQLKELPIEELPDPALLLLELTAAARTSRISESIRAARHAVAIAKAYADYELMVAEEDEEEAIMLLLN